MECRFNIDQIWDARSLFLLEPSIEVILNPSVNYPLKRISGVMPVGVQVGSVHVASSTP